jgi:AsmA protein
MPPPTEEAEGTAEGEAGDGKAAPTQWSDEEIDVSALNTANVDFDLQVESIKAREIEVGESALAVRLKDGRLAADLTKLSLYDGSGTGALLVDSRPSAPKMGMAFDLTGVAAKPLLTDAAGFERLEGTGDIQFDVAAQGDSQKALIADLDGEGAISFTDGAIVGINVAKMVRNVGNAFTGGGGTQKTDFAELAGTFTIMDGVLKNDDLVMLNPLLRVRGAGTADLNQRTVDYRLTPKAVASLEGQGGDVERSGIAVPVIIKGPWHDISYRPDMEAVLKDAIKDPEAMKKDAEKAIKSLKESGDIGSALDGLTGGASGGDGAAASGDGQGDGGAADQAKDKLKDAKDTIKGLFE